MRNTTFKIAAILAMTAQAGQVHASSHETALLETDTTAQHVISGAQMKDVAAKCDFDQASNTASQLACKAASGVTTFLSKAFPQVAVANLLGQKNRHAIQEGTLAMGMHMETMTPSLKLSFKF